MIKLTPSSIGVMVDTLRYSGREFCQSVQAHYLHFILSHLIYFLQLQEKNTPCSQGVNV